MFKWGKLGVFGTYAFMDNAIINNVAAVLPNGITSPDLFTQTYLRVVNQAGASFTFALWGNNYLEGNLGYLKSYVYGDRAGGTLRFIFPINDKIAFTVEGGLNETMLGTGNRGRSRPACSSATRCGPRNFWRRITRSRWTCRGAL